MSKSVNIVIVKTIERLRNSGRTSLETESTTDSPEIQSLNKPLHDSSSESSDRRLMSTNLKTIFGFQIYIELLFAMDSPSGLSNALRKPKKKKSKKNPFDTLKFVKIVCFSSGHGSLTCAWLRSIYLSENSQVSFSRTTHSPSARVFFFVCIIKIRFFI